MDMNRELEKAVKRAKEVLTDYYQTDKDQSEEDVGLAEEIIHLVIRGIPERLDKGDIDYLLELIDIEKESLDSDDDPSTLNEIKAKLERR